MRLIDADALIVSNKECEQTKTCRTCKMYVKKCEDLFDLIANTPTITVQPEYESVTAEDFTKTMLENTVYKYIAWYGEALALMKEQGFVICKRTM